MLPLRRRLGQVLVQQLVLVLVPRPLVQVRVLPLRRRLGQVLPLRLRRQLVPGLQQGLRPVQQLRQQLAQTQAKAWPR